MSNFRVIPFLLCIPAVFSACTHEPERTPQSTKTDRECIEYPNRGFRVGETLTVNSNFSLKTVEDKETYVIAKTKQGELKTMMKHPTKRFIPSNTILTITDIRAVDAQLTLKSANGTVYLLNCFKVDGKASVCKPEHLYGLGLNPNPLCTEYTIEPASFEKTVPKNSYDTDIEI